MLLMLEGRRGWMSPGALARRLPEVLLARGRLASLSVHSCGASASMRPMPCCSRPCDWTITSS